MTMEQEQKECTSLQPKETLDTSTSLKCNKCGACCYCRVMDGDRAIETKVKCQYLDENNLCSVYESRPSWCLTAEEMIEQGLIKHLPDSCGYKGG